MLPAFNESRLPFPSLHTLYYVAELVKHSALYLIDKRVCENIHMGSKDNQN